MSPKQTRGNKNYLPFIIIAVVLAVAIAAAAMLFNPGTNSTSNTSTNTSASVPASTSPQVKPPMMLTETTPPGGQPPHVRGEANAPVTLEEFGDFQCPPCGRLHPELKKLEDLYGPRLKVVFRNFPLASHEHAVNAARAAEAAGRQGRFWEMHDMIYEQQDVWKNDPDVRARFTTYARTLGLNVERFQADMTAPAIMERIIADQTRGRAVGVSGTPTIFVDGREVEAASGTYDGLRAKIDAALMQKKQ
ncbi:MAG TPA: thioredoxin domain-containing protein [Pyrinomonadaceae bacterium]|nr:thioredoxin domain-containing protein [Pyrinomonadaceae bacterium]